MSNALPKRKRKNDDWYDWADGELPPPQTGWLAQLLGWSWRVIKAPFRWAWRQSVAVLRWAWRTTGRATRWTLRVTWAVTVWTVVAPIRGVRWLFGSKEPVPQNRYEEIRQRIRRHYRRRNRFITHLLLFILGDGLLWINVASATHYPEYMQTVVLQQTIGISVVWAVVLLFHYIRVRMADAEDLALETALERERAWEQQRDLPYDYSSRLMEAEAPPEWEEWEAAQPPEKAKRR
ncbi:MAG: hypothetical protein H6672_05110 [Anaerolineaceae bacterium]|nr:hypothetical protein [Anaerolineaceae bacterium]